MSIEAFVRHHGVLAPLLRDNIDTDAIIPSREMKRVSREGLAEGLFAGWRYLPGDSRQPDPEFVLNKARYAGTSILAGGKNFGCGSSREHAVWALVEYGIRAILAPSYAAIFERNCVNNGLLPIRLSEAEIRSVLDSTEGDPKKDRLEIDLEQQIIRLPDGSEQSFSMGKVQRAMLINGWDPIDQTLQFTDSIADFEARDRLARGWAYPRK